MTAPVQVLGVSRRHPYRASIRVSKARDDRARVMGAASMADVDVFLRQSQLESILMEVALLADVESMPVSSLAELMGAASMADVERHQWLTWMFVMGAASMADVEPMVVERPARVDHKDCCSAGILAGGVWCCKRARD